MSSSYIWQGLWACVTCNRMSYTMYTPCIWEFQFIRIAGSWGYLTGSWWETTLHFIAILINVRKKKVPVICSSSLWIKYSLLWCSLILQASNQNIFFLIQWISYPFFMSLCNQKKKLSWNISYMYINKQAGNWECRGIENWVFNFYLLS